MKGFIVTAGFLLLAQLYSCSQPDPSPYGALPTNAQLAWHEMEMYCLVHFGVDTYTDQEWGYGDEDPQILNPENFDAEQIVAAAKAGGFKGVVVVAKHHDGFCLWPTKTTEHNITKSPWKDGRGDMIREYQIACDKLGMKLGLYCSPWDRNSAAYGNSEYVDIYRAQLRELYSNYGPLFISWHDGANGGSGYYGGTREVRKIDRTTYYGWDTTWAIIRELQPSAVIFGDIGPDVRWVGNEKGYAGETSWATYTPQAPDEGKEPAIGYSKSWEATEGTRNGKYWMPAECDVPMRPGWFYHASQDDQVKSPYTLLDLYYRSVGRGACLDLGIAPNRAGRLPDTDVQVLQQFGDLVTRIFADNLIQGATLTASNVRGGNDRRYGPDFLTDRDRYSYWATDDSVRTPWLTIDFKGQQTFNVIRLRENIKLGQRITAFAFDVREGDQWRSIAEATSIGSNRLIRLSQHVTTDKVRLRITGADACVALSDIGFFKEPPHLTAPAIERDKQGMVRLIPAAPVERIQYTLDGTDPEPGSPVYSQPFLIADGGQVKARSMEGDNQYSGISSRRFGLAKTKWSMIAKGETHALRAIDEDEKTHFRMRADTSGQGDYVGEFIVDLGEVRNLSAFSYLPRQDRNKDGVIDRYGYYVSLNGSDWEKVAAGEFANIASNPVEQITRLDKPAKARYFKLSALHVIEGKSLSVAELGVVTGDRK